MSDEAKPATIAPAGVVLVSGGSRGLGLHIVEDLLAAGVSVATFARSETPAFKRLTDEFPGRYYAEPVDATDLAAVTAFLKRASAVVGDFDGLVNNAAIGQDSLHIHTSPEAIGGIVTTNLTAPLLLTRLMIRKMLARGTGGRIVNITSICAQRGFPGLVTYAATKGAMEAATRALARELRDRVLINCIAPGFFASEMSAVLGATELDQIVRRTPTGQLSEPEHVTPLVRMLLLEQTNMQGQVLTVDGGAGT